MDFLQDNQRISKKGVIRGLHFQKHHPQGKLMRALSGTLYDVEVDLRKVSPNTLELYYLRRIKFKCIFHLDLHMVLNLWKMIPFYLPKVTDYHHKYNCNEIM